VNETPLVSVIVPAYNHAQYIETCLQSIYDDDYPELEVIVMDDGSRDDTFEVARRWRETRPGRFGQFRLERQENRGLPRTLNRLTSLATGEFIALVASDDYLLPGGITTRLRALEAHPEWLAVFGDAHIVDGDGALLHSSGTLGFKGRHAEIFAHSHRMANELIFRWWVPGPTMMMRRSALDPISGVGGYDESLSFEDRDMYLRLIARNALGFVSEQVAAYRFPLEKQHLKPPEWILRDEARTDLKNLSSFRGFQRAGLWVRAHRIEVKLTTDHGTRGGFDRIKLCGLNALWGVFQAAHRGRTRWWTRKW
jgi:glycosyltransferase involved in cell wall biosynthesis